MKPQFAAALAALLLPSLRAEDEKPDVPKPPAPSIAVPKDDAPKEDGAPEKEKPRPREEKPPKPAPRPEAKRDADRPSPERGSASKRTWLGVATEPVAPSLREHLEIPEGFAIQIAEVVPGSPAAKAGLRSNDVLVRFEDQRLISPEHLALLVRGKGKGDRVPLILIRKGREELVEVVLDEAPEDQFAPRWSPHHPPVPPRYRPDPQWQEQMRRRQDDILRQQREWQERHRPAGKWHERNEGGQPRPKQDRTDKPGGRPPSISVNPGFPLRLFSADGVLKIDNEQGELTLTRKGDDYRLVIKDAAGKVVYDGVFDPAKGVGGLPEEVRRQLDAMKLDNLEIHLPNPPASVPEKTAPEKTAEPEEQKETPGELL